MGKKNKSGAKRVEPIPKYNWSNQDTTNKIDGDMWKMSVERTPKWAKENGFGGRERKEKHRAM